MQRVSICSYAHMLVCVHALPACNESTYVRKKKTAHSSPTIHHNCTILTLARCPIPYNIASRPAAIHGIGCPLTCLPPVLVRGRVHLAVDAALRKYESYRRQGGYSWYAVREVRFPGKCSVVAAGALPVGDGHIFLPVPAPDSRLSHDCFEQHGWMLLCW
ncbi:hypothetical protein F5Y08DRAFT_272621 [Xylaria arbuscula]|nr:hypothetical protein F5Y08DRAFT_272621 [Xylaria arbuscula]